MRIPVFLVALLAATPVAAQNQLYQTGNDWNQLCSAPIESFQFGVCLGAIIGLGYYEAGLNTLGMRKIYCTPEGVTQGQRIAVFRKFLADNPALLHEHTAQLMLKAFAAAFPCKK